jgi:hypothetical protein
MHHDTRIDGWSYSCVLSPAASPPRWIRPLARIIGSPFASISFTYLPMIGTSPLIRNCFSDWTNRGGAMAGVVREPEVEAMEG